MSDEESSPRTKRVPRCKCSDTPLDKDCFVVTSTNPKIPGKENIQAYFHNFYYALFYYWSKIDPKLDPKAARDKMKEAQNKLFNSMAAKDRAALPSNFSDYRFTEFQKAGKLEKYKVFLEAAEKYPVFKATNYKVSDLPPKKKKASADDKNYYTYYFQTDGIIKLEVTKEKFIRTQPYAPKSYAIAQNGAKPRQFVIMFNIDEGKNKKQEENKVFKERFPSPDFDVTPTGLVIVFGKTLINGLKADGIPIQTLDAMKAGKPVERVLSDVIDGEADIVTYFRSSLFSQTKKDEKKKEEKPSDDYLSNFVPPESVPENKRPSSASKGAKLKKKKESNAISQEDFDE